MSSWLTLSQNSGNSGTTKVTISGDSYSIYTYRVAHLNVATQKRHIGIEIEQNKQVPTPYFTVYYETTADNQSIKIINSPADIPSNISEYLIDSGVSWLTDVVARYTFETAGIHRIDYKLSTNSITRSLFNGCENIVDIYVDGYYETVQTYAFAGDYKCTGLTIGNGVKTIQTDAFRQVYISTLTLPSSIISIGSKAFGGNNLLNTIYSYADTAPNIYNDTFTNKYGVTLHYPSGSNYSSWINKYPNWMYIADL